MSSRRHKIGYGNEEDSTKDATAMFDNSDYFFFTLANDNEERSSSSNKNVDPPKKQEKMHHSDKKRTGQPKQPSSAHGQTPETEEEEQYLRYDDDVDMLEPSLLTEEDYDYSIQTDLYAEAEEARMMMFSPSEPHKMEESATDESQQPQHREVVVVMDETTPKGFLSQRIIALGKAQKEKKRKLLQQQQQQNDNYDKQQVIAGAAVGAVAAVATGTSDANIDTLPTEIIAADAAMQSASVDKDVDEETVSLDLNDLQPPSTRRRRSNQASTETTHDENVQNSYVNEILALTGQASSNKNILLQAENDNDNESSDEDDDDSSEGYVYEILRLTKDSDKDSSSEMDDELAAEKKKEKRKRKKKRKGDEKAKYRDTNDHDEEETKPGAVTVRNRRNDAQQEEPTRPGAVAVPGFPDDDSQTSGGVIPPPSFFGNPLPSNVWTGGVEDEEMGGGAPTRGAPGNAVVVPEDFSSSTPGAQQMQGRAGGAYPEWGRRLRQQMRSLSGRDSVPPAVAVVDVADSKATPPPKGPVKKAGRVRWVVMCIVLGIIMAVGLGVGLGVGVSPNNESNETSGPMGTPVEPMPTQSPTTMPTSLQDSLQRGGNIDGLVAGDGFGFSTVLSSDGNIMAAGGYNNVRVFLYDEALMDWIQLGQDIPPVEAAGDVSSGTSVSLSSDGSTVAIGTPFNNHVRVLQYSPTANTWSQLGQTIEGEGSGDQAGFSVSLSSNGNILAIGSPLHDGNGLDAGQVRVFKLNGETNSWSQLGQVMNTDISRSEDAFGLSVALSNDGNILAVGAPGTFLCDCLGYVRVYKYDATNSNATTWVPLGEPIDGKFLGDQFGFSISLSSSGNVLAIGAPSNDGNGDASGHVQVFLYTGLMTNWIQLGQDIEGDMAEDFAGTSVSLSSDGSLVAIGGPGNDGNGQDSGHVRVFQFDTNNWIQEDEFLGEAAADQSGISVSLSDDGNIVAIGADFNAGGANSVEEDAGHVRVYERQNIP